VRAAQRARAGAGRQRGDGGDFGRLRLSGEKVGNVPPACGAVRYSARFPDKYDKTPRASYAHIVTVQ
ncbi:hypothetical protein, partial [Xanthomonas sacchari]|uniref:hypothetical protein n=1 Tax=Xanthomonas sacchari TaxID=56458 RepID=UPI0022565B84